MYFIGDETMLPMEKFSIGAATQCNDAHIVDFFAAMAAVHFFRSDEGNHCYYISRNDDRAFKWDDLPKVEMHDGNEISVQERLVQFVRFVFAYLYIVKPKLSDLAIEKLPLHDYPWYKNYWKDKIDVRSSDVRNFEQYAEYFVEWLNQVEHSAGARAVELINPKSFSIKNHNAKILPEFFSTLDYGNSQVTTAKIETALARGERRGGVISKIFRRNQNTDDFGEGFGLFLRRLYDSCKAN